MPSAVVFQFTDINPGDRPVVTADFASVTYANANGSFTAVAGQGTPPPACRRCSSPTSWRLRSISTCCRTAGNTNNGKVAWVYAVPGQRVRLSGCRRDAHLHLSRHGRQSIYNGTTGSRCRSTHHRRHRHQRPAGHHHRQADPADPFRGRHGHLGRHADSAEWRRDQRHLRLHRRRPDRYATRSTDTHGHVSSDRRADQRPR